MKESELYCSDCWPNASAIKGDRCPHVEPRLTDEELTVELDKYSRQWWLDNIYLMSVEATAAVHNYYENPDSLTNAAALRWATKRLRLAVEELTKEQDKELQ
jgi:hypothetical protein